MRRLLWTALVLAGLCWPSSSKAYVRTSSVGPQGPVCVWWPKRNLSWWMNEKGSADVARPALESSLQRSFQHWEDVECSDFTFEYEGTTPRTDVAFDPTPTEGEPPNINVVVFREQLCDLHDPPIATTDPCRAARTCADVYDCWEGSSGVIALTFVNYSRVLGAAADADVEFNGAPDSSGVEWRFTATIAEGPKCQQTTDTGCVSTDVENTATHEFGHVVGLDHVGIPDATMFRSADIGETSKRTLDADDTTALCDIYPAAGPTLLCVDDPSGSIRFEEVSRSQGCASAGMPLNWLVLVLPALVRRRVRARG